jgi:hypothetical protein
MNSVEADLVRAEIESATRRAERAESSLRECTQERDQLRALLSRLKTSLVEVMNDPGNDGAPP